MKKLTGNPIGNLLMVSQVMTVGIGQPLADSINTHPNSGSFVHVLILSRKLASDKLGAVQTSFTRLTQIADTYS